MGKLFGTDGIRGIVGENLTVELAFHTGQAIAAVLKEEKGRAPLITIGKDTRISSDMLESALICGICSVGGDVMPFGVLPTPAVDVYKRQGRHRCGREEGREHRREHPAGEVRRRRHHHPQGQEGLPQGRDQVSTMHESLRSAVCGGFFAAAPQGLAF